ncbi:hypothetical protein DYE50_01805 [Treponema ruminis]|nr:hypothetical protein DYE50_01805 [Treponema ruminis]
MSDIIGIYLSSSSNRYQAKLAQLLSPISPSRLTEELLKIINY